jgi:hypothetical protein
MKMGNNSGLRVFVFHLSLRSGVHTFKTKVQANREKNQIETNSLWQGDMGQGLLISGFID